MTRLVWLLATLQAVLARVCKTDAARRLPWAPYWKFDLRGCTGLYLAHSGLGRGGAEALATSLRTNHELKELNLFNNSIGDAGAHRLAEALEHDTVLTSLFLERNGISNEGLVDLAEHLEANTAITTLGLYDNGLGATSRDAIARARFVGLEWADGEYKRTAVKSPSNAGPAALPAPVLSFITPSPAPSPPPPVSAECSVVCGHATCSQMASIGLICRDTRLVCGDACSGCCHFLSPPAPPPPLAPCMDLIEGCLLDDRAVCTGAPSLAKSVCMATCGVCDTSAPSSSGLGYLVRAAEALPSTHRGLITPFSLLGAAAVGVVLALAAAMAVSRRRGSGPAELN